VLHFHGDPDSRLQFPDPQAAVELHVRVLTIDRPGVGGSDPQPGHRIVDWSSDVLVLADALGLERFGVVGWSAGAPYALACAATIPERLTGVAITTSASAFSYLYDDPEVRDALVDDDELAILEALRGASLPRRGRQPTISKDGSGRSTTVLSSSSSASMSETSGTSTTPSVA
jgi:pimeloyl-ACP methyl ester carboxylesterase